MTKLLSARLLQSSIFNLQSSIFSPCFLSSSLYFSPLSSSLVQSQLQTSSSTASTPAASFSTATPPPKTLISLSQTRPPFPSDVLFTLLKSPPGHPTPPTSFPSLPPSFSPFLRIKTASPDMDLLSYSRPPSAWTG